MHYPIISTTIPKDELLKTFSVPINVLTTSTLHGGVLYSYLLDMNNNFVIIIVFTCRYMICILLE
jgi:hypothetical protein